jgi:hypothetical protein
MTIDFDPAAVPSPVVTPPVPTDESAAAEPARPNRFAAAGRLGAERVHQLIRFGEEYEREHGLKRGRQRLRQLIQLGRRYEQEHGLAGPARRKRRTREDVWAGFLKALSAVVKPAYRAEAERLAASLRAAEPTAKAA